MKFKYRVEDKIKIIRDHDGQNAWCVGRTGVVTKVGHRIGGRPYENYKIWVDGRYMYARADELAKVKERRHMSKVALTQRVRNAFRSKEDKALINGGFMYESGALTKEGRKVVVNLLLENDKTLKAKLVEAALAISEEEK